MDKASRTLSRRVKMSIIWSRILVLVSIAQAEQAGLNWLEIMGSTSRAL
jgi:hypothetical protein